MELVAVRNLRLCTKDCLCLFVCPVGATDTENSIIDTTRCIGCEACAKACPSQAIHMVPRVYPERPPKDDEIAGMMKALAQKKVDEEMMMRSIAKNTESDGLYRLMTAMQVSAQLLGADAMREADYMLPQSDNIKAFLQALYDEADDNFPVNLPYGLLTKLF